MLSHWFFLFEVMLGAIPLVMTDDYIKKVTKRPAQERTALIVTIITVLLHLTVMLKLYLKGQGQVIFFPFLSIIYFPGFFKNRQKG